MFERFTDRARRAVVLAQEEARTMKHSYIGTEHLLVALAMPVLGGSTPGALASIGLDVEAVREKVNGIAGVGEHQPASYIPFTPRHKKVLEGALREALNMSHSYISPDHLLLSLVNRHLGDGVAGSILLAATPAGVTVPLVFDASREEWFAPGTQSARPDKVPNAGEVDASRPEAVNAKMTVDEFRASLKVLIDSADQDELMLAALSLGKKIEDVTAVDWFGRAHQV